MNIFLNKTTLDYKLVKVICPQPPPKIVSDTYFIGQFLSREWQVTEKSITTLHTTVNLVHVELGNLLDIETGHYKGSEL